jgi:hypothetical protein
MPSPAAADPAPAAADPAPAAADPEPAASIAADEAPAGKGPLLDGLDFGGAKFKIAVPWDDGNFKAAITEFDPKYNCEIEYVEYGWGDYEFFALAAMADDPIDIVYAHHLFYPDIIIADVMIPLDDYIQPVDWAIPGQPGGLSPELTDLFKWKGKNYFVASGKAVQTQCFYYNKLKFNEAGLEDPLDLYKAGNWTWEKFLDQARQVNDPANGVYFTAGLGRTGEWLCFTGAEAIAIENGNPVSMLDSENFFLAMDEYQKIIGGQNTINEPWGDEQLLRDGTVYMMRHNSEIYDNAMGWAAESSAFGMNTENIGMVPVPIHPLN